MTDTLRDTIAQTIRATEVETDYLVMADAVLAVLRDNVPPLVWDGFTSGPYKIEVHKGGTADLWFCGAAIEDDDEHELLQGGYLTLVSMDEHKAAANTHNRAQVMASLGVTV